MQLLSSGQHDEYPVRYMPFPFRERRRFEPRVFVITFLIATFGMLLVAGLARGSGADAASVITNTRECTLGSCPLTITENDNGRTLNYGIGTRFTILTDGAMANTSLSCDTKGVLKQLAFEDTATTFAPTLRYETANRGTCVLRHGSFKVQINVSRFR